MAKESVDHWEQLQTAQDQGKFAADDQSLLEVLHLQSLLQQQNMSLRTLTVEKEDANQTIEQLTSQLRQTTSVLDNSKEEIWNLELTKQDMVQQQDKLQRQLQRALVNYQHLAQQEAEVRLELEQLKQQHLHCQDSLEQAKHDQIDLAITKRRLAALQQQLHQQQTRAEQMPTSSLSHQPLPRSSLPPLAISPSQSMPPAQHQHDHWQLPAHVQQQAALARAEDTIQALQAALEHERAKRSEMEQLWRDAQDTIENACQSPLPPPAAPAPRNPTKDYLTALLPSHMLLPAPDTSLLLETISPTDSALPGSVHSPSSTPSLPAFSLSEELSMADAKQQEASAKGYTDVGLCVAALPCHSNLDELEAYEALAFGSLITTGSYIYEPMRRRVSSSTSPRSPATETAVPSAPSLSSSLGPQAIPAHPAPKVNLAFPPPQLDDEPDQPLAHNSVRALTTTMIGSWMWKYSRKWMGSGLSHKRNKRFVWLHPYSNTLYWSTAEPGLHRQEGRTKSVLVDSFMIIDDCPNQVPSFYIQAERRHIKIQCLDEVSYRAWFKSLKYLLIDVPPTTPPVVDPVPATLHADAHPLPVPRSRRPQTQEETQAKNQRRLTKLLKYHNHFYAAPPSPPPAVDEVPQPQKHQRHSTFYPNASAFKPHHSSKRKTIYF